MLPSCANSSILTTSVWAAEEEIEPHACRPAIDRQGVREAIVAMHPLPDDVLADVLGRLPPPSLAACRCVSKAWRDFVNVRDTLRLRLLPAKVAGLLLLLRGGTNGDFQLFARPTAGPAVPRRGEYLPSDLHGRLRGHCNGVLVFPGVVVANPATRQWTRLPTPPPPCPEISPLLFHEHLAFDPTLSRHYEVFLIPSVPTARYSDAVFFPETAEWPPSRFSLRVFSSKSWRWDERSFLREGKGAGTVAEMRLLQDDIRRGLGNMRQSVYWNGALYASCGGNFFMRKISMSTGKYQVIEPPIGIQLCEYPVLHLGRTNTEVCCALIHDRCRLQTWFLKESSGGQMEWVPKHQVDFGYELAQCEYGDQLHGPWMVYDDDDELIRQAQEKSVHESQRSRDSVYGGENYGQYGEDEDNSHDESDQDASDYEEEDERCEVPLKFEWDSDNDNIIERKDVVKRRSNLDITFLGFHPTKEIVFLEESSSRGVAYHFDGAKVQDLGELQFSELDYTQNSFVYTPCRMTLP